MAVTEDTVDTATGVAVAKMTQSPQAKTVCKALPSEARVISIEPLDIGFLREATIC